MRRYDAPQDEPMMGSRLTDVNPTGQARSP